MAKKINIDFYFTWSGNKGCVLSYLYVNGVPLANPKTHDPRGPITMTVTKRSKYFMEWGLEFIGSTRRNLRLRADLGQTGKTKIISGKPATETHIWPRKRMVKGAA